MNFALVVLPILLLVAVYGGLLLLGLMAYILRCIGLYTMAKNTAEEQPWLAWIPFAHEYLVGKMADRYTTTQGKSPCYARSLLIILIVCAGLMLSIFAEMFLLVFAGAFFSLGNENIASLIILLQFSSFFIWYFSFIAAIIAFKVFQVVAHYQLYRSFAPEKATLYTVLTLFSLDFICKFLMRNNIPVGVAGIYSGAQPKYRTDPNKQGQA